MVAVVATVVAAALALALVFTVERPAASATPTVVTLHAVGGEQIAHDRSEQGLGSSASVSGEQVAHNRSEEGLANPYWGFAKAVAELERFATAYLVL